MLGQELNNVILGVDNKPQFGKVLSYVICFLIEVNILGLILEILHTFNELFNQGINDSLIFR